MSASHVAGVIQIIMNSPTPPAGISPPPVPPNAAIPYVTVQEIENRELESLSGLSGLSRSLMQINCWDKSHEIAASTRTYIKSVVLSFSGPSGGGIIQSVNHQMDAELYDADRKLHQLITRLWVWWEA